MKSDFIDALYALKDIKHEDVLGEFKMLLKFYEDNVLLHSRYISSDVFNQFLNVNKCSKVVESFIRILYEKNLLMLLPDLVKAYEKRILNSQGIYKLYITTSLKLSKNELDMIVKIMANATGLKFIVHMKIDSKLLSGVTIQYNERYINLSGIYDLYTLKQEMINNIEK